MQPDRLCHPNFSRLRTEGVLHSCKHLFSFPSTDTSLSLLCTATCTRNDIFGVQYPITRRSTPYPSRSSKECNIYPNTHIPGIWSIRISEDCCLAQSMASCTRTESPMKMWISSVASTNMFEPHFLHFQSFAPKTDTHSRRASQASSGDVHRGRFSFNDREIRCSTRKYEPSWIST